MWPWTNYFIFLICEIPPSAYIVSQRIKWDNIHTRARSTVKCQLHQWNVLCSNAPQFLQRFPKTYIILSLLCNRRNKFLVRNECPEIARVQALFCRETIIPQTKINECWKCSKAHCQVLEKCKLTCRTLIFPTPKSSKKTPLVLF